MKYRIAALTAVCLMAFSAFSGCAADRDNTEETSTITEPFAADEMLEDEPLADVIRKSFVSAGNTYRLSEKLSKAAAGEDITCAFIGGSITEGYTVQPDECYAKLTYEWIKEEYHAEKLEYNNAGISGTPSILGNLRLDRDVPDADIVFVEFAVNDGMENIYRESYDSLVYSLLERDNEPAVILLLNRTEQGHSAQEYMKQIGSYYDLGMISTADALTFALDEGLMVWGDYYNDSSHPSPKGHSFFLECIKYYFAKAAERSDDSYEIKEVALYGAPYRNAVLAEADYDNSDERLLMGDIGCFDMSASGVNNFRSGWRYDPDSDKNCMSFTATGNSLFLVCHRNNNSSMGKMEIYVNDRKLSVIDTNSKDGWGDPWAYQIIKWQTVKTMEVRVEVPADSKDKTCEILAIGVTGG